MRSRTVGGPIRGEKILPSQVVLFRLVALCAVLFGTVTHARPLPGPPDDIWPALEVTAPVEPWLSRVAGCALAPAEVFGPFRPYACFPPLSATVGVTDTGGLLSFESPTQPGCGDALPTRLERWSPTARGANRVDLTRLPRGIIADSDQALAAVLATVFREASLALGTGFTPPAPSIETARLDAGDVSVAAALLLGPPLAGQLLWLDVEGKRIVLSSPERSTVLGRLPATFGKARPSFIEAVATPDASHLVVRIEGLRGSPCDPASVVRLVFAVPASHRNAKAWPSPAGDTMRRCQAGERVACERLCNAGHCRPLARLGNLSVSQLRALAGACDDESALDCAALRVLGQETCRREGQDSAACLAIEAALTRPVMVKGGPPVVETWRRLTWACEGGETSSCAELVERFESQPFRIPREAAVAAHRRLIDQLTRRCAYHDEACRALAAARARAP